MGRTYRENVQDMYRKYIGNALETYRKQEIYRKHIGNRWETCRKHIGNIGDIGNI